MRTTAHFAGGVTVSLEIVGQWRKLIPTTGPRQRRAKPGVRKFRRVKAVAVDIPANHPDRKAWEATIGREYMEEYRNHQWERCFHWTPAELEKYPDA